MYAPIRVQMLVRTRVCVPALVRTLVLRGTHVSMRARVFSFLNGGEADRSAIVQGETRQPPWDTGNSCKARTCREMGLVIGITGLDSGIDLLRCGSRSLRPGAEDTTTSQDEV